MSEVLMKPKSPLSLAMGRVDAAEEAEYEKKQPYIATIYNTNPMPEAHPAPQDAQTGQLVVASPAQSDNRVDTLKRHNEARLHALLAERNAFWDQKHAIDRQIQDCQDAIHHLSRMLAEMRP